METKVHIGAKRITNGTTAPNARSVTDTLNTTLELKKYEFVAAAQIEETDIGATAETEKRLSSASCAKIIPAMGALNPEEIAAATPQAIKTSCLTKLRENFVIIVEIVAPKWTRGPYWPTEAPALAEINAASVEPRPTFTSTPTLDCWRA